MFAWKWLCYNKWSDPWLGMRGGWKLFGPPSLYPNPPCFSEKPLYPEKKFCSFIEKKERSRADALVLSQKNQEISSCFRSVATTLLLRSVSPILLLPFFLGNCSHRMSAVEVRVGSVAIYNPCFIWQNVPFFRGNLLINTQCFTKYAKKLVNHLYFSLKVYVATLAVCTQPGIQYSSRYYLIGEEALAQVLSVAQVWKARLIHRREKRRKQVRKREKGKALCPFGGKICCFWC